MTKALYLIDTDTHAIVPREPTYGINKMSYAGASALPAVEGITGDAGRIACKVYTAMLAAAPDSSRPLPTREEIARLLFGINVRDLAGKKPSTRIRDVWWKDFSDMRRKYLKQADAVLALLAGDGK